MSDNKILFLDGARGVAALLVLFSHIFSGSFLSYPFIRAGLSASGHSGVELFFVLSGFLIGRQFLQAGAGDFDYKSYFKRRALRVLPLFLVSSVIFFIAYFLEHRNAAVFKIIPYYLLQVHNFFSDANLVNPPTWTVAVEIHFYLFLALFFCIPASRSKSGFFTGVAILFIVVAGYRLYAYEAVAKGANLRDLVYANSWARMDHFFVGVLLAWFYLVKPAWFRKEKALWFLLSGLILHTGLILAEMNGLPLFFSVNFLGILTSFAWGLLICSGLMGAAGLVKFLSTGPLRFCGRISYSMYLLHLPVYTIFFEPLFYRYFSQQPTFCAFLFIPFMLLLAALSYAVVEKPFLQWKTRYAGKQGVAS